MQIEYSQIRPGDIVEFKGSGLVFNLLSPVIKLCFRDWNRWGWHLAIVSHKLNGDWMIFEELGTGAQISKLSNTPIENLRFYRWFDVEPDYNHIIDFEETYQGEAYDVQLYFWTAIQYFAMRLFHRRVNKILNHRWTCWELVCEFCGKMGKPLVPLMVCPILPDLLRKLEK